MNMLTRFATRLWLLVTLMVLCQQSAFGQLHTEKDGFQWEEFGEKYEKGTGVKDANGKIIIPQTKGLSIRYAKAESGSVSLGYFYLYRFNGSKNYSGIADTNGKIIIPAKYGKAGALVKMCGRDTLLYFYTGDDYKTPKTTYYDYSGKKLFTVNVDVELADDGSLHDFKTKLSLGLRIPSANGHLSNFYHTIPTEVIKTQLGDFYATVQHDEGLDWKLLSLSDGSICGAVSMSDKVLVPVSDRAHELKYEDGFFYGRQEGKEGKAFVYDSLGNVVISITDGHSHINRDVSTKEYFEVTNFVENSNMNDEALYDLQGNLLIPIGEYYSIRPKNYKGTRYFVVGKKDGSHGILDANLCPLLSLSDRDIYSIEYRKDTLGVYYKIGRSSGGKQYIGILGENGTTIIAPNKYDLIDDRRVGATAYYEVTRIEGNDYSNQKFLHGICDITGREVIAPEYDYISQYNGKIELKKGNQTYISNVDLSHPAKFPTIQAGGLFYLLNNNEERINPIGYQTLAYNDEQFCYTASIDGYTTTLSPSGSEANPILNQMFSKAYSLMETKPDEAIRIYNRIIEIDKGDNFLGLKSQAANNIGYIYHKRGNNEKAIEHYRQALDFSPTNQIAQNNLDNLLYPPVETVIVEEVEEERMSGWDIAANILGILNNAVTTYSNFRQNQQGTGSTSSSYRNNSTRTRRETTQGGRSVSDVQNERTARRTYGNYVSQLSEMSVWPEKYYNDSQRRQIQSSMRQIRQRWGFAKSEWEDWNGVK